MLKRELFIKTINIDYIKTSGGPMLNKEFETKKQNFWTKIKEQQFIQMLFCILFALFSPTKMNSTGTFYFE